MTDWNDPALNPAGLKLIDQQPKQVHVTIAARCLAQFKGANGKNYICALVDPSRPRIVFEETETGFIEATDRDIQFVAAKWTGEILESMRR